MPQVYTSSHHHSRLDTMRRTKTERNIHFLCVLFSIYTIYLQFYTKLNSKNFCILFLLNRGFVQKLKVTLNTIKKNNQKLLNQSLKSLKVLWRHGFCCLLFYVKWEDCLSASHITNTNNKAVDYTGKTNSKLKTITEVWNICNLNLDYTLIIFAWLREALCWARLTSLVQVTLQGLHQNTDATWFIEVFCWEVNFASSSFCCSFFLCFSPFRCCSLLSGPENVMEQMSQIRLTSFFCVGA